jgi:hypothetical protein
LYIEWFREDSNTSNVTELILRMPAWIPPDALNWLGDALAIEARVLFLWLYVRSSDG